MKMRLIPTVFVGLFLTSGLVLAGSHKAQDAIATYMAAQTDKELVKAAKELGEANDCDSDCDCQKSAATEALVEIAKDCSNPEAAKAAAKELSKDLKSKHKHRRDRVMKAMKNGQP